MGFNNKELFWLSIFSESHTIIHSYLGWILNIIRSDMTTEVNRNSCQQDTNVINFLCNFSAESYINVLIVTTRNEIPQ